MKENEEANQVIRQMCGAVTSSDNSKITGLI
jgi:hypothetical protein